MAEWSFSMLRSIHADDYLTVTLDTDTRLVRFTRNAQPYATIDEVRTQHAALTKMLAGISSKSHALLIDLRAAIPRNDSAFEAEISRIVVLVVGAFRKHAFLVKTAVGSLQVRRMSAANGTTPEATFSSEAEALAYLSDKRLPM
jgi:hypothetical protein